MRTPITVQSNAYSTRNARRCIRVLERTKAAPLIAYAGRYNCRPIRVRAGYGGRRSGTMSQHSYGNADDLFPRQPSSNDDRERRAIFHVIIWQATHRTRANRFRRLAIAHVIDHDARLIWTPDRGIHAYTGSTGNHVHVDYPPTYSGPCGNRP